MFPSVGSYLFVLLYDKIPMAYIDVYNSSQVEVLDSKVWFLGNPDKLHFLLSFRYKNKAIL